MTQIRGHLLPHLIDSEGDGIAPLRLAQFLPSPPFTSDKCFQAGYN